MSRLVLTKSVTIPGSGYGMPPRTLLAGQSTPVAASLLCPRCKFTGLFVNIDGGLTYRCARCEWIFTLSAVAPTGTSTAGLAAGGLAITVASGGASFTAGMVLLFDPAVAVNAEPLTVTATGSTTNIPVTAATKAHNSGASQGADRQRELPPGSVEKMRRITHQSLDFSLPVGFAGRKPRRASIQPGRMAGGLIGLS